MFVLKHSGIQNLLCIVLFSSKTRILLKLVEPKCSRFVQLCFKKYSFSSREVKLYNPSSKNKYDKIEISIYLLKTILLVKNITRNIKLLYYGTYTIQNLN